MRKDPFNLIVTHYPGYDNYIVVREKLRKVIEDAKIIDTSQSVILLLAVDPYEAVEKIKNSQEFSSSPILRVIPVDAVTDVFVDRIKEAVHDIFKMKAHAGESFRIKIDGRVYKRGQGEVVRLHRSEAIEFIAQGLDNPVNLEKPDWLIYIKTLRLYRATELASITVSRPEQILSFAPKEQVVEDEEL